MEQHSKANKSIGLEITKKETPEASNAINSLFLLKEEIEKIVAKKQLIGKSQV
jgi:hypothetical protein